MNAKIRALLFTSFMLPLLGMQPPKRSLIKIIRDETKTEDQKIEEIIDLFVKNGVDINAKSLDIPYSTPLMMAADGGYLKIVQFLLDNKADINALDSLNNPALFYAARKGHVDIVKLLFSRGAKIINHINKQGRTILQDILFQYGSNMPDSSQKEARTKFKKDIYNTIELLINNGADINKQGSPAELARSPIIWAAFWKDIDLLRLFKKKNANICTKDQFGNSLSYYLKTEAKEEKNLSAEDKEFLKMLDKEVDKCEWGFIEKEG